MPSKRALAALIDIRDNIDLALDFACELSAEDFGRDKLRYYAIERCLEIISEASRRLPDDLKSRHATLQWPQIAAPGNVYRHGYDALSPARIRDTVEIALPPLRIAVVAEIKSFEGED